MIIRMTLDVEVDAKTFGMDNPEEREWFFSMLAMPPTSREGLVLWSNFIGDQLGPCRLVGEPVEVKP